MTIIRPINLYNAYEYSNLLSFFKSYHLSYQREDIDFCVGIFNEDDRLIGTASLSNYVIRNVAIDPKYQGEGLVPLLLSEIISWGSRQGRYYFQLFTKPINIPYFTGSGFRLIIKTEKAALLEFGPVSLVRWLSECKKKYLIPDTPLASIVMNCNPFTLGHLHLVEYAAKKEATVLIFVVEENASLLPFHDRLTLVRKGVAHLKNVIVCPSGPYIISKGTFPSYFLKKEEALSVQTELDLLLFSTKIAPFLKINTRYVGTEPIDLVTKEYNQMMSQILSTHQIMLHILNRKMYLDSPISASLVRKLWAEKNWSTLSNLVPPTTLEYLKLHSNEDNKLGDL